MSEVLLVVPSVGYSENTQPNERFKTHNEFLIQLVLLCAESICQDGDNPSIYCVGGHSLANEDTLKKVQVETGSNYPVVTDNQTSYSFTTNMENVKDQIDKGRFEHAIVVSRKIGSTRLKKVIERLGINESVEVKTIKDIEPAKLNQVIKDLADEIKPTKLDWIRESVMYMIYLLPIYGTRIEQNLSLKRKKHRELTSSNIGHY